VHARQVAEEQLVLQGLGPGGNDDLAPRHQGGDQVGEGLAGAGAGFGDQDIALVDGRGHRAGHALLRLAGRETGYFTGERALRAEDRGHIGCSHPSSIAYNGSLFVFQSAPLRGASREPTHG
jgi:hypothetical protein